jgi:hypothetical protein
MINVLSLSKKNLLVHKRNMGVLGWTRGSKNSVTPLGKIREPDRSKKKEGAEAPSFLTDC